MSTGYFLYLTDSHQPWNGFASCREVRFNSLSHGQSGSTDIFKTINFQFACCKTTQNVHTMKMFGVCILHMKKAAGDSPVRRIHKSVWVLRQRVEQDAGYHIFVYSTSILYHYKLSNVVVFLIDIFINVCYVDCIFLFFYHFLGMWHKKLSKYVIIVHKSAIIM